MLRSSFPGHRRYSITHRAVQRLRELVPGLGDGDDEHVRDQLDQAIAKAEDEDKAIRTLDVMLSEPQVLVPLESFGEVLYAIIKEETVVTVLPRGHGEEILQRGQALEQRVAAGEVRMQDEPERWDHRRRWRRDATPIVERIMRPSNLNGTQTVSSDALEVQATPPPSVTVRSPVVVRTPAPVAKPTPAPVPAPAPVPTPTPAPAVVEEVITPKRPKPVTPVQRAIARGLELGRRRAAIAALRETVRSVDPETAFQPIWEVLNRQGVAGAITLGDLCQALGRPHDDT